MRIVNALAMLFVLGVLLVWPWHCALTAGVASEQPAAANSSTAEEWRSRVSRLTMQNCDPSLGSYCLNNGECMLIVEVNEHHCKCERGYYGHRCSYVEFVSQPMGEKQLALVIVCVTLLIIGLAGALYFFCKWYKKNRCPRQQKQNGFKGVQSA